MSIRFTTKLAPQEKRKRSKARKGSAFLLFMELYRQKHLAADPLLDLELKHHIFKNNLQQ